MIIFLYGEDTFRSRQKLKELKDRFTREVDTSGGSIVDLAGESLSVEALSEAVGARSLFARKRMIIVENVFNNKSDKILEKVFDYFKKQSGKKEKSEDNIIIFWDEMSGAKLEKNKLFKFLSEQQYAQNFKKLSNTEIAAWIKKELTAREAKIKPQAVSNLASMFGSDLWQLHNEIDKLVNFKKAQLLPESEAVISEEDVESLSRGNVDANIFALTDAIGSKNKALAVKLLEQEIEAGVAEQYLLTMVIRQFKILLQVKEATETGMSPRKMTSQLHLHPFVVQKCSAQVRSFSMPLLKNIFSGLLEIDKAIKSGQGDFKSALDLMIVKI